MGFQASERVLALNAQLEEFMQEHIYPREHEWEAFTLDQDNLLRRRSLPRLRLPPSIYARNRLWLTDAIPV